ncbi:MAG: efflux RND transporter permease subunit [Alphaproteobacteria bacterium]|nr:efflux RND transporter permease subunit [Alphaproteobacteria bacterium]
MYRWIIGSSLRFRFIVVAVAAALIYFGAGRLRDMPVDVFPEFAPPLVEIQTEGPGMSTVEVEELITVPLEQILRGTPELDSMRSKSVVGLSSIQMLFERGTDILHARQLVNERLQLAAADLPPSASLPRMLQPLSATSRVMKIGLTSPDMSLMDLSMIAYWKMRFRLLQVPGVANVALYGERLKALQLQLDPDLMRIHEVNLPDVLKETSEALDVGLLPYSSSKTTQVEGFVDSANQRFDIEFRTPVFTPEHFGRLPVGTKNRAARGNDGDDILRLSDIGDVLWAPPQLIGDAVINDGPGLMVIVEKFSWSNTLDVTLGVEAALEELAPALAGLEIDTEIFRPATFIELSIENLTVALMIGAALVVLVLGAFLYEWRVALISTLAIPLSLVAAGIVLYLSGATLNTMVLAGFVVALGAVVDDAIVDIENIVRRLRQHRRAGSPVSTARVVLEASLEVRSAIVFATLIIVFAVIPVFFMGGLSGSFFGPLATSYVLALLASMVVAMTVTPALALILLDGVPLERRESPLIVFLQRRYERALRRMLQVPRRVFAAASVIVIAGIAIWPMLGQSLLPSFMERDFLMHWLTKPGTSHPEMYRITVPPSIELRAIPGVRNFGAHIGRAIAADEVVGIYFTENWISVDPSADYDETLARIQQTVDGYPGIYRDVQTYLKERIREVLTGSGEAIVVRIYGEDIRQLRAEGRKVAEALRDIEGLVDLHVELQDDVPLIQVTADQGATAEAGLVPGDIQRTASLIFAGKEVSDMHFDNQVYDVIVWSKPEFRDSLTDVEDALIHTPDGDYVRMSDVADVKIVPSPNVIRRDDSSRRIDVQANVNDRDLGAVAQEVLSRLDGMTFPLGYHVELLGEYTERQAAQSRLLFASIIAAVGILLILQASLRSWRLTILAYITLPAALVGGSIAAFVTGGVISLGSLVGFLAVLGIVARNGILLLDHYQHLQREEGQTFGPELVIRGARERLAPILMTATTTALALLPVAISGEVPGHEIEHPMAVVILGGLITSTLLNLTVVPLLYARYGTPAMPLDDLFRDRPDEAKHLV